MLYRYSTCLSACIRYNGMIPCLESLQWVVVQCPSGLEGWCLLGFFASFCWGCCFVGCSVGRLVACLGYVWFFGIEALREKLSAWFVSAASWTLRVSLLMMYLLVCLLFSLVLMISLPDLPYDYLLYFVRFPSFTLSILKYSLAL